MNTTYKNAPRLLNNRVKFTPHRRCYIYSHRKIHFNKKSLEKVLLSFWWICGKKKS